MDWTVERVKDELPDITVKCEGIVNPLKARVTGRLNQFATVSIYNHPWYCEAAWETIVHCLNTGKPLTL